MSNFTHTPPPKSRLVMTIALPYANGPLHLGHGAEAIQADIFARYRRAAGQDVVFVCADDCHGTAIELLAAAEGKTPEQVLQEVDASHRADYAQANISFDNYHSTHSPENEAIAFEFFDELKTGGHLRRRRVPQLYDPQAGRFLDDRRVRGTCPSCGRKDQHGDSCDCGQTYDAIQLIDPVSTLTGARPEIREAEHLYFVLEGFEAEIRAWMAKGAVQGAVAAKLEEWLNDGLRDWCITRSGPYFGIPVPGEADLYFYVWLDAPIGYIASLQNHLSKTDPTRGWQHDWRADETEIIHFIGKDIINFHGLFWPALLRASGCRLPDRVHAHGFVTVGGQKMSKSKGNSARLQQILADVDAEALRYVLAARMADGVGDINIDGPGIVEKVNSDLVGKFTNIATRVRPLFARFGDRLSDDLADEAQYQQALAHVCDALAAFEAVNTAAAVRSIIALADLTNEALVKAAPWSESDVTRARASCTQALVQFRLIAALLQPICPGLAQRCLAIFGQDNVAWADMPTAPLGQAIAIPPRLFERVELSQLAALTPAPPMPKDVT